LFEDQVERTPNDVAVIYESEQLTYQELNQRANQLAHYLRRQGVGADMLIGVFMQRSVELIIGLLAVLKAGCAFVTLDPGYPESRLAYMLDDTHICLILSQEGLSDKLPKFGGKVLLLDHDRDLFIQESKTNPPIDTTPDNLACVFYTSGSTGTPKGVLIAHRGVVNYLDYLVNRYKIGDDDVVLQLASPSFDSSIRDTIGPLTTGASVVLVNVVDTKDPAALLAKIKEHRVSRLLSIGPTLLNALITSTQDRDRSYPSIRTVLVSGEDLYAVDVRNAMAFFGDQALIVNQYGPTEITMIASSYPHGFHETGMSTDQHPESISAFRRDIPTCGPLGEIGTNVNGTEWEMPHWDRAHEVCVHQLFEAQVNQTPEAIAIQYENQQLTYAELNARANRLAHLLQKLGVKQDVLVGIFIEPSLELLIGVLGILKAGGAYVPLDTLYPRERLAIILSDIRAPVIVTSEELRSRLPENSAHTVCLDSDARLLARQSVENPSSQVTTDNLAYVVYTSGSTGAPKGVHTTHRALTNLLSAVGRRLQVTADDVLLSVTKLIFDIATLDLFLPLSVGARVVVASWETTSDGYLLKEKLPSSGATIMQATPTLWQLLVSVGWQGDGRLKALSGGETLPRTLADELLRRCGSVWNLYGPSETTIYSTVHKVVPEKGTVSIGRPIANTQIYILDEHLNPVPIGVPGEIHVGGVGVARGYLNRPQLTAERFIPDIFSRDPGARLYKTGDLARYRPDGNIEFLGRLDHQVKIRGFRIEPGEIEEVLIEHKSVRETVIKAIEDESGGSRLIAYMVPNAGQQPSVKEVRGFLKERLPDFMIPSAFVVLDAMPLTPNGKVDRKALPLPEKVRPELESDFMPPRTPVEEKLSAIWAGLLGLENIGINDNFFELGGHSLLATRVISRVREEFKVKLDLRLFFSTEPTISNLAQSIETLQWMAQKERPPHEFSTGERDEGDL
jgi:amino acid adenylation domain-containing protein